MTDEEDDDTQETTVKYHVRRRSGAFGDKNFPEQQVRKEAFTASEHTEVDAIMDFLGLDEDEAHAIVESAREHGGENLIIELQRTEVDD